MALIALTVFVLLVAMAAAMASADARHHGLGRHWRRTPDAW